MSPALVNCENMFRVFECENMFYFLRFGQLYFVFTIPKRGLRNLAVLFLNSVSPRG